MVLRIVPSVPWIRVSAGEVSTHPNHRHPFVVTLLPPNRGIVSESITITTTCLERPTIILAIEGEVVGNLVVRPSHVILGTVAPGTEHTVTLVLRSTDHVEAVGVATAMIEDPRWKVVKHEVGPSGEFTVLRATFCVPIVVGHHRTLLRIGLSPGEPVVDVPIATVVMQPE
jgi:hypothetical protein